MKADLCHKQARCINDSAALEPRAALEGRWTGSLAGAKTSLTHPSGRWPRWACRGSRWRSGRCPLNAAQRSTAQRSVPRSGGRARSPGPLPAWDIFPHAETKQRKHAQCHHRLVPAQRNWRFRPSRASALLCSCSRHGEADREKSEQQPGIVCRAAPLVCLIPLLSNPQLHHRPASRRCFCLPALSRPPLTSVPTTRSRARQQKKGGRIAEHKKNNLMSARRAAYMSTPSVQQPLRSRW